MTDTPPPAVPPTPGPTPVLPYAPPPVGFLGHAAVSAVIGLIFLSLGWPFFDWAIAALTRRPYETGYVWPDASPLAGQPVAYFDLDFGAAWRDVGLFATAVTLLIEALLFVLMHLRPAVARPLLTIAFVVAVAGCGANAVSAVMQWRAGWHQPTYAIIGLAVCVVSAVSARQRRREIFA